MSQLTPEETEVAHAVLEGPPCKHVARQWVGTEGKAAAATKRKTIK